MLVAPGVSPGSNANHISSPQNGRQEFTDTARGSRRALLAMLSASYRERCCTFRPYGARNLFVARSPGGY